MSKKINRVAHYPGYHCASTGIRNIVNYHGIPWSEAMCFGIGAGLGIWYLSFPGVSPSRLIHVRSEDIERQYFARIGCHFNWECHDDPEKSEKTLIDKIDIGVPVMLQTDIYYLPYYNTSTHFPGHVITAWGYDREKEVFYVTDTEREDLLEVPFDNMRKARYSNHGFFKSRGNLFAPRQLSQPVDLPGIIREAVIYNSSSLLQKDVDFVGVNALDRWERELNAWKSFEDWRWTARFTYQVIEKRGTGGGGFRFLYTDFLNESVKFLPVIASLDLPRMMHRVAVAWRELATALKEASDNTTPDFSNVREKLLLVKTHETAYHQEALKLTGE